MADKKRGRPEKPLYLDMPFDEALERYSKVRAEEIDANIGVSKQKKPPGTGKTAKPSGSNVTSLRSKRNARRRKTGA